MVKEKKLLIGGLVCFDINLDSFSVVISQNISFICIHIG